MKQCIYCGAQAEDDSSFCTKCGKPIPQQKVCPHCGAKINDGDVFCTSCGKEIGKAIEDAPSSKKNRNLTESKKKHFKSKFVFPLLTTIIIIALICSAYFVWRNLSKDYSLEGLAKAIPNYNTWDFQYYPPRFHDGLVRVGKDEKWGFIDKTGKEVIPCIYEVVHVFSEGFAAVYKDGKFGFIDKSGKEVVPCIYDGANDFSEGFAVVYKNEKFGIIDKSGKEVIPCKYTSVGDFHDGLARVENESFKCGYIDKSGKEVIPCKYTGAANFHDGLARIRKNEKWGVIDKSGKEIIPCIYEDANDFSEGFAAVRKEGKSGYVDKTGKEVIPCKYARTEDFKEGLALVYTNTNYYNKEYFYIDKFGKKVIPCIYDGTYGFSEGLARVYNEKYGFIDKTGKEVIPCIYDGAGDFGKAGLAMIKKDGKYGYIDKSGVEVIPCIYEDAFDFSEGLAFVSKDGIMGVVDTKGNSTFNIDGGKIIEDGSRKVSSSEKQKIDDVGSTKGKESSNPKQVNPAPNATSQDYNEKIMMHTTEIQNIMREMNSIYNSCIASSALNPDQARGVNACADISELALEGDRHFKAMISLSRKEGHPEHAKAIQQEMDDFDYKANQMTRNILRLNDSMYN